MLSGLALTAMLSVAPGDGGGDLVVARALHEKGTEYLESEQFEKAATLFAELHERTGDPFALYNQAQAERLSGDCDAAVPLYRAFLGTKDLDDRDRFHATENIERCGGDPTPLPPLPAPAPASSAKVPEPAPAAEPKRRRRQRDEELDALPPPRLDQSSPPPPPSVLDEDRPAPRSVVRDPVGWSLVGAGAVGIAVGIPFQVIGSRGADETPGDDETEAEFVDRVEGGRRQRAVGTALIATGSVLAVAGIVRFVVLATKAKRSRGNLATLGRF